MLKKTESFQYFENSEDLEFVPTGEFYVNKRENVPLHMSHDSFRRDFYKLIFIEKGSGLLHFGDKTIAVAKNTLFFSNPETPFSWDPENSEQTGFFCMFTKDFIFNSQDLQRDYLQSVLDSDNFVLPLNKEDTGFIRVIIENIYSEAQSGYVSKYDLLRNYTWIILHKLIKGNDNSLPHQHNASERISRMFLNILESSFLINSPSDTIRLKTPFAFARQLSVHVNHLNRALKASTGKTTTDLISARIMHEAKSLLKHTNWSISDISNCLHFQHPSNFQAFFKKQTGLSPKEFRKNGIGHI